ncbi:MAG: sigma-70 family RNA polymerase sigma factor [Bacilli bacterium]
MPRIEIDDVPEIKELIEKEKNKSSSAAIKDTTMKNLRLLKEHPEDIELRNQIVIDNYGLVVREAQKYANYSNWKIEDLIQEGSLGLINAVRDFDTTKGSQFSTLAVPYIRNAIFSFLSENSRIISIPRNIQAKIKKIQDAKRELSQKNGHEPSDAEIADFIGFKEDEVTSLARYSSTIYSLDRNNSSEEETKLINIVADKDNTPQEESEECEMNLIFHQAIDSLSEREKDVYLRINGIDRRKETLKEISSDYKVSLERVRQISVTSENKIKAFVRKKLGQ